MYILSRTGKTEIRGVNRNTADYNILIFDLEIEDQDHEEERRRLHLGCQIESNTIYEKMAVLYQTAFCVVHQ